MTQTIQAILLNHLFGRIANRDAISANDFPIPIEEVITIAKGCYPDMYFEIVVDDEKNKWLVYQKNIDPESQE
jgi:hypothetical protein